MKSTLELFELKGEGCELTALVEREPEGKEVELTLTLTMWDGESAFYSMSVQEAKALAAFLVEVTHDD